MKADWVRKIAHEWPLALGTCLLLPSVSCQQQKATPVTVPIVLDHNRMLVDAEIQRSDGTWRPARLWIDTGNPDFFISPDLARDLQVGLYAGGSTPTITGEPLEVPPPRGVRIGGMPLDFRGVHSMVMYEPAWLFSTMFNDANLPSAVLKRYQVVFDYPARKLTLAEPGALEPRGVRAPASIHPETGIVQIDAAVAGDTLSLALDNGASYSFVSDEALERLSQEHPGWPRSAGAVGCANIWGWWPGEPAWPVLRLPEIQWGPARLADVGLVGLPRFFPNGMDVGTWYSQKCARPVAGFLGPNAIKAFRVTIDYANSAVYFEKTAEFDSHDMDLVGLTLRPMPEGKYLVIGVAEKDGQPAVAGVLPGDRLLEIGDLEVTGATMGTVVDALRGKPGEVRVLVVERDGERITVEGRVERFL